MIPKHTFLDACVLTSLVVGASWAASASVVAEPARPNIVFFLVDDMGWQDTSVAFHDRRTPFNDFFHTPGMERLARAGVRFTQAYACAVCTPTRVSWLTGRNAARHHVTNWTLKGDTSRQSSVLLPPPWKMEGLQPGDAPTAAALLRDAGYRTIHVGKAHWGAVGTPGSDPLNLGFDVNIAGHAAGAPESYQGRDRYGEGKPGKEVWAVPGLQEYKGTDTHLTDALTLEACRELEKSVRELKKPFFLYLAHYAVHTPLQPHRPYDDRYRGQSVARSEVLYASMVEGMDASLGKVLDKLKELGVARDTLVVFYTDNGGVSHAVRGQNILGTGRDTHNKPLREGKGSAYEGGIRVPAMVAWAEPQPDHPLQQRIPVRSGARCARPIIIEDLFPTFLRWAGVESPAGAAVDGEDLTPLLAGPSQTERRSPLIWHFPNVWTPYPAGSRVGYQPHSVIRVGNWKAIYFYESERWELYDLAADLEEANDLAGKEPGRLEGLAATLRDRLIALESPWPVDRATGQPRVMKLPGAPAGNASPGAGEPGAASAPAQGASWPQFRGPSGDGLAPDAQPPVVWSETTNVAWKVTVTGCGRSSPVLLGDRVWLTAAVAQGVVRKRIGPDDMQAAEHVSLRAVCLDRGTGQLLWETTLFEVPNPDPVHWLNSWATPTPVVEPGRVYCDFGTFGTVCLEAATGKVLWQQQLRLDHQVGPGSSPVLYQDRLVLVRDGRDAQYVAALDKTTGETLWKTDRPPIQTSSGNLKKSFSTALIIQPDGQTQLVAPGAHWTVAYHPLTGKELWRVRHGNGFSIGTSPVFGHGLVYFGTGCFRPQLWAVRADGQGDVSGTHVAWKTLRQVPVMSSPVLVGDELYWVSDDGMASCVNARTGEVHWQERLGGACLASPIAAQGRLYFFRQDATTVVLRAGTQFERLAENPLEGTLVATPAVADRALYLRTDSHLYCLRGE